jgi:hypothetical protein
MVHSRLPGFPDPPDAGSVTVTVDVAAVGPIPPHPVSPIAIPAKTATAFGNLALI